MPEKFTPAEVISQQIARPSLRERLLVLCAVMIASACAVAWSWKNKAFLLYGDAEAHIHIARRLFDSHRPGITQLGSVWLPLPHLLLVPFVAVDSWWRNGFAAVLPSATCYLLACLGIYLICRKWLSPLPSALALAFFATNPNLLYLQTTAMTEPLFLCELIWTVLLLLEWQCSLQSSANKQRSERLLWAIVGVLVAAIYTRYDGWILASIAWVAMAICLARRARLLRTGFVLASIVLLLAPLGWMVYNAVVFGDWLDFMRGPYSARMIELRTAISAISPHPGWHNPWVSAVYFEKAAELDAAAMGWGPLLFTVVLLGAGIAFLRHRRITLASEVAQSIRPSVAWTQLLWLPLPFYAYSVSYGSVPIFLPVWVPFSYYNTRYGMELLPGFTIFLGFFLGAGLAFVSAHRPHLKFVSAAALFIALAANVAGMLKQGPIVYMEGKRNSEARGYYNTEIPKVLSRLHSLDPDSLVLMDTSPFPSIVPHAGLTYRQTLNESDKEFYQAALAAPAAHAALILAFAGDEVDTAVKAHPEHLRTYQVFHFKDQLNATIYVADTSAAAR